ncbi:MAG: zinc ribbon domain-containing protein [Candidatus Eremiobacteraeota bacterium]|nr:zinc ribbon domain-containing protein [Candidatus Eremiobacteraeota bacterium]
MSSQQEIVFGSLARLWASRDKESSFVIINADVPRNYYVQFSTAPGDILCGEAVGNAHLKEEHRIPESRMEELLSKGWEQESEPGSSPFRQWHIAGEASLREVASEVVELLGRVYGIPRGQAITIEEDTWGPRETSISIPGEGLVSISDEGPSLFCPSCGTPRKGDDDFCGECGERFSP